MNKKRLLAITLVSVCLWSSPSYACFDWLWAYLGYETPTRSLSVQPRPVDEERGEGRALPQRESGSSSSSSEESKHTSSALKAEATDPLDGIPHQLTRFGPFHVYLPEGVLQTIEEGTGNTVLSLPQVAIVVLIRDIYVSENRDVTDLLSAAAKARPETFKSLNRRLQVMCSDIERRGKKKEAAQFLGCILATLERMGIHEDSAEAIPVILQRDSIKRASRVLIQNDKNGILIKVPDEL